jgi:hypothetical protein
VRGAESYRRLRLREADLLASAPTTIEEHAEQHSSRRNEESDYQPDEKRAVDALLKSGDKGERQGEDERDPARPAGGGEAEAETGEEEDQVGGDFHGPLI